MKLKIIISLILLSLTVLAQEQEIQNLADESSNLEQFSHDKKIASIQILNKITAKVQNVNIPINTDIAYGTLKIEVKSCWKSSPYELSENKILMNIYEKKIGQKEYQQIFFGWMFSSSPGISSMEHPVYDVVAINCLD
jgi:hypothetical protein